MVALCYGICLRQEVFRIRTHFLTTQKVKYSCLFYFHCMTFIIDPFYLVLKLFVTTFFSLVSINVLNYFSPGFVSYR